VHNNLLTEKINFANPKNKTMEIFIKTFTFNGFQENTVVLYDSLKNCVIIDPGCYNREEQNELLEEQVEELNKKLAIFELENMELRLRIEVYNAFKKE
jgi:hypothetical protein